MRPMKRRPGSQGATAGRSFFSRRKCAAKDLLYYRLGRMEQSTVIFDRRQVYRPFLERLSPSSPGVLGAQNLIVTPEHDPRDPDQPPIHVAFANNAELNRGVQMALVGGIGSGKTTELWLTGKLLKRHKDAISI